VADGVGGGDVTGCPFCRGGDAGVEGGFPLGVGVAVVVSAGVEVLQLAERDKSGGGLGNVEGLPVFAGEVLVVLLAHDAVPIHAASVAGVGPEPEFEEIALVLDAHSPGDGRTLTVFGVIVAGAADQRGAPVELRVIRRDVGGVEVVVGAGVDAGVGHAGDESAEKSRGGRVGRGEAAAVVGRACGRATATDAALAHAEGVVTKGFEALVNGGLLLVVVEQGP